MKDGQWIKINDAVTNQDGRISGKQLIADDAFVPGQYRITFDTKSYFERHNIEYFYPYAQIVFIVRDASQHYHVPLLLSPFGYSTYRGS